MRRLTAIVLAPSLILSSCITGWGQAQCDAFSVPMHQFRPDPRSDAGMFVHQAMSLPGATTSQPSVGHRKVNVNQDAAALGNLPAASAPILNPMGRLQYVMDLVGSVTEGRSEAMSEISAGFQAYRVDKRKNNPLIYARARPAREVVDLGDGYGLHLTFDFEPLKKQSIIVGLNPDGTVNAGTVLARSGGHMSSDQGWIPHYGAVLLSDEDRAFIKSQVESFLDTLSDRDKYVNYRQEVMEEMRGRSEYRRRGLTLVAVVSKDHRPSGYFQMLDDPIGDPRSGARDLKLESNARKDEETRLRLKAAQALEARSNPPRLSFEYPLRTVLQWEHNLRRIAYQYPAPMRLMFFRALATYLDNEVPQAECLEALDPGLLVPLSILSSRHLLWTHQALKEFSDHLMEIVGRIQRETGKTPMVVEVAAGYGDLSNGLISLLPTVKIVATEPQPGHEKKYSYDENILLQRKVKNLVVSDIVDGTFRQKLDIPTDREVIVIAALLPGGVGLEEALIRQSEVHNLMIVHTYIQDTNEKRSGDDSIAPDPQNWSETPIILNPAIWFGPGKQIAAEDGVTPKGWIYQRLELHVLRRTSAPSAPGEERTGAQKVRNLKASDRIDLLLARLSPRAVRSIWENKRLILAAEETNEGFEKLMKNFPDQTTLVALKRRLKKGELRPVSPSIRIQSLETLISAAKERCPMQTSLIS